MRREGVPVELIAPTMGHSDSTMIETVYGRLDGAELGKQIANVISIRTAMEKRRKKAG
jgi:hypothetical protein